MILQRRRKIGWIACAAVALTATVAIAAVSLVERSTKTKGATTITWDSSFQDMDYTLGDTVTFTANWDVDAGAAEYDGFTLKKVTPKSRRDPAEGWMGDVSQDGNSVTVEFTFTGLHLDRVRDVEIGNAHFKLYLMIDKDGDGEVESRAGYGVNLHVEDPQ